VRAPVTVSKDSHRAGCGVDAARQGGEKGCFAVEHRDLHPRFEADGEDKAWSALGLTVTTLFFALGFGAEIAQAMAVAGQHNAYRREREVAHTRGSAFVVICLRPTDVEPLRQSRRRNTRACARRRW
jgi:hypothetical protein